MTNNFKKHFINNAIPGWEDIDKNELANLCIKYENDPIYEKYVSALISKYLYKSITLKNRFGSYLSDEELNDRIVDGVLRALEYRSWLKPEAKVYGDPSGPDKTINRCIKTQCQVYKRLNFGTEGKNPAYKRRIKYFTESIDNLQEEYGDYYYNLLTRNDTADNSMDFLVEKYIKKDLLDAILIDNICYQDSLKEKVKKKKIISEEGENETIEVVKNTFDKRKVIKNVLNMNDNYMRYFSTKYKINIKELYNINDMISKYTESNNKFLYKKLDKLINSLRNNQYLLEGFN